MSPSERTVLGRRDPVRPQYATSTPGFSPPYYPPYGVPPPSAWLGAPLISMTRYVPPSNTHTAVSKLAAHTQGAPLIIQNRYDRRKHNYSQEQRNYRSCYQECKDSCEVDSRVRHQQQTRFSSSRGGRNNNTDAVSVASDESSGSTNSETMLPRIIKPRKRRKKDRKTNNVASHDDSIGLLDFSEINFPLESETSDLSHSVFEKPHPQNKEIFYHLDFSVLKHSDAGSYRLPSGKETLNVSRFGSVDISPTESTISSCYCRYCEPASQTWDASSIGDLLDDNSSGEFAPTKLEDSMKIVGSLGRRRTDTTLRRSWSDPSSPAERRNDANVDSLSSPRFYSLFPPTKINSTSEPISPINSEFSSDISTILSCCKNEEGMFPSGELCNGKSESSIDECSTFDDNVKSVPDSENTDVSDLQCTFKCDLALVTG